MPPNTSLPLKTYIVEVIVGLLVTAFVFTLYLKFWILVSTSIMSSNPSLLMSDKIGEDINAPSIGKAHNGFPVFPSKIETEEDVVFIVIMEVSLLYIDSIFAPPAITSKELS